MKKILLFTALFILFVSQPFISKGQTKEELEKLQKSTVYVVIDEEANDNNRKYSELFTKYWTFSKVEVISSSQLGENLQIGNFFITMKFRYEEGFNFERPATLQHFSLCLWTPKEKEFKKFVNSTKKKDFDYSSIADEWSCKSIMTDKSDPFTYDNFMTGEFFGNGHALFGGLGFVKNWIQATQIRFEKLLNGEKYEAVYKEKVNFMGTSKKLFVYIKNKDEIMKLKKETLYIPATFLVNNELNGPSFNHYLHKKKPPYKAKDIFIDYPAKYEVISLKDMNEKIMSAEEPFFYIMKDGSFAIQVVNALTGEVIYKQEIRSQESFENYYIDQLSDIIDGTSK